MTSRERSRNVDGSTDLEYQAREKSRPGRQPRTRRSGSARARTGGRGDGSTRRDGERLRSAVAGWYGTAATRTICRGERGGGGTRGSRELVGGASRVSRQAGDARRQTAGRWKASSELRPWDEERLCLVEGGTLARSSGRRCRRPRSSSSGSKYGGGRGTDGGRGVSAVY